MDINQKIKSV